MPKVVTVATYTVSLITVTTPTFCMPIESCSCIPTRDSFF